MFKLKQYILKIQIKVNKMNLEEQIINSSDQKSNKSSRIPQIQCIFQDMFSVSNGNIFLSNYEAASNIKILKGKFNKKQAVLSFAIGNLLPHTKQQIPNYLYVPAEDTPQYNLKDNCQIILDFIEKNRKKTNVLIHCVSGKSRCTAIAIFYLMKKYSYKCSQAYEMIKRAKPNIKPNIGFLRQLNQLNLQLYGSQDKKITQMVAQIQKQNRIIDKNQNNSQSPLKSRIKQNQQEQNIQKPPTDTDKNEKYYISDQKRKSLSLIADNLRKQSQLIEDKILQVRKTIQNHQNRKRTKSQYLRKRLQEARQKSLKKGEEGIKCSKQGQKFKAIEKYNRKEALYRTSPNRNDILNKKYGMQIPQTGVQKRLFF